MAQAAWSASGPGEEAVRRAVLDNELRSEVATSVLGGALIVGVNAYLATEFWERTDRTALIVWLSAIALIMTVWAGAVGLRLAGRVFWEDDPAAQGRFARGLMTACNIATAAGVLILMPAADPGMRTVLLVLYLWYLGVQLLGATEASQVALSAIVMVIGALVGFLLIERGPHAIELSVILIAFGVTMLALRRFLRTAVVTAAAERARSEQARASLADALGVVAAERDAKTRFIEAASHDLQQPLHAAGLYLEHALDADEPAERDRAAAGVRKALSSTQALLETMLDHLRMEAGAAPVRIAPVALGALIGDAAFEHGPAARAAGMTLRDLPSNLVVRADKNLLRRALGNLVANAIRHSRGEHVLIAARVRGDTAELWVIDDGEGIAADDRATLFETFARGRHARTAGFGIGLASARAAIELMGGTIALDTRWTGGSAFRIRLPLHIAPARAEAACAAA